MSQELGGRGAQAFERRVPGRCRPSPGSRGATFPAVEAIRLAAGVATRGI